MNPWTLPSYPGCLPGPKLIVNYSDLVRPPTDVKTDVVSANWVTLKWKLGKLFKHYHLRDLKLKNEFIVNTRTSKIIYFCATASFLLIAALIFSAGYYCARIFYNSKNLNCIGALSFYDSKRSIGEVLFFFLINFIGVIFKAGNETREKIWSGFCAEQN